MTSPDQRSEIYVDRIESVCAAVADHDLQRVLAHFDDACVFVDGGSGEEGGKEALVAFLEEVWSMFPDYTPRAAAVHVEGDTIGVVFELTGTPVSGADAGAGAQPVRWLATAFSTFDPESLLITRDTYFIDAAAFEKVLTAAASA